MKKLFVMAAMVLSSVGAFAQQAAGTTTIQPKVGLNVSTIADGDWKAGFAAGAELQYQATDKLGLAVGALYSAQGTKSDHVTWTPGYINVPVTLNYYVAQGLALKAGIQPGFMVGKDDMPDELVKTFDLSVPVGLSYEYSNLVFDARYNIGCTKVFKHSDEGYNNVIQMVTSSLSNRELLIRQNNNPRSSLRRAGIFFLVISV